MFKYNLTVNTLDNDYVENNTYFCNKVDNLHWKKVVVKKDKFPVYVATNMTGTSTITTKKRPRTIGGHGYKN